MDQSLWAKMRSFARWISVPILRGHCYSHSNGATTLRFVSPFSSTDSIVSSAEGYLKRGLRQIGPALPVDLIVEFDQRVAEKPFRSRTSVIAEALCHFLNCPQANWEAGDHPPDA